MHPIRGGGRIRAVHWDSFIDELGEWLEARGLLEYRAAWVIGVSGGPDSMLLLHALKALADRRELGWALHAAHLNHGLRGAEAEGDAEFVADLAEKLGIGRHIERADIAGQVAEQGGSVEEIGRQRRYEFLERVALKTGSDCVAVAHHADDDAETIFHRICRGTGLRGLAGMPEMRAIQPGSRVRLVRPLLHYRREVVRALCAERGIESRLDATNEDIQFTRGRIRNAILPMLRKSLNPNISEALLRLAEQARWLGTYLEDAAARTFDSLVVSEAPDRIVLNTHALMSKQRIIQAEVVRRAISLVLAGEQDLGFSHVDAVLKLAGDSASGKELHLPGPVLVRKLYDRLEFRPLSDADPEPVFESVQVKCPGTTALPLLRAELTAEVWDVDAAKIGELRQGHNPYEEWLDIERVRRPLLVRGRHEGDRFHPLGAPGSKSLSDFLISEKVDPQLRARTGVLCDQDGPIWVMPLRIDERVKLRATSRHALRLVLSIRPEQRAAGS